MGSIKLLKNIRVFFNITIAWFFSLHLYYFIIYMTLDEVNATELSILNWFSFVTVLSLVFGALSGFLEIYILRDRLKRIRFSLAVLYKTTLFITVFIISVIIFIAVKNFVLAPLGIIIGDPPRENEILVFLGSTLFYKHGFIVIIMSFMINFFFQIKSKMGKGVLFNLFVGKYHSPRKEERIIMFLDLTSATAIAEKLDLFKYSLFLKDFFSEIDDVINQTKGAIFQFVGDEVVILWNMKDGLENNNCIKFFFLAQERISEKKEVFMNKFNLFPEFKAGLHFGEVIITEVGITKQEIAYHGDTVNTAARIRSVCNDVNRKFLISADLLSQLANVDDYFRVESIGLSNLRGKKNILGLFSIEQRKDIPQY